MRNLALKLLMGMAAFIESLPLFSQALPATEGETLTGKRVILSNVVHGHAAVLVAGFSREGGSGTGAWIKAIHSDTALNGVAVYTVAVIAEAPTFVRGMIKSEMRKGVPPAEQDNFVVLTQDEKLWEHYFDVSTDKDPYVVLIDSSGKVLWHGHGPPADLEPQLKTAVR